MQYRHIILRMVIVTILAVGPILGWGVPDAQAADNIHALYEAINKYYLAFDTIQSIKKDLREAPDYYVNHLALAYAYIKLGLYWRAISSMDDVIRLFPTDEKGLDLFYTNQAYLYMSVGNWYKAKPLLEKALEINPDSEDARQELVHYYLYYGQDARAAELIGQLSGSSDGKEDIYYKTLLYMEKKNMPDERIISFFERALQTRPRSPQAHRGLAIALREHGDSIQANWDRILGLLEKALELDPGYIPAYISIADSYFFRVMENDQENYNEEALSWLNKARSVNPKDASLLRSLVLFYMYTDKLDRAFEHYEQLLENGHQSEQLAGMLAYGYNNKAYDYYESGENLEEGLRMIDRAIQLRPNAGILLGTKAELLFKLGRLQEAYDFIIQAMRLAPDNEEIQADYKAITEALERQEASPSVVQPLPAPSTE